MSRREVIIRMELIDFMEVRRCNVCGEEWEDDGEQECPFCESVDTFIVTDEDFQGE